MSNIIKLSKEETRDIWRAEHPDFELVEEGEWEVDYKWQHVTGIVEQTSTGKFFSFSIGRSGDPYSDYYYSYEAEGTELMEVHKVVKTIVTEVWEIVNE